MDKGNNTPQGRDPYFENLSSLSRRLAVLKLATWLAWAAVFVWTAYTHIELGAAILLCLLGTWLVVTLGHDLEEGVRRRQELERELHTREEQESLMRQTQALERLDNSEFNRLLDEEWDRIRSARGIRYQQGIPSGPYTDTLGRPLSPPILHSLSVERSKLIINLALKHPEAYKSFYQELLEGNAYLASTLPTPEEVERHKGTCLNAEEFLIAWRKEES